MGPININILSREVITSMGFPDIWKFHVSAYDANVVTTWHYGLAVDTNTGTSLHPSIVYIPWSDIYTGATSDPYPYTWGVFENGTGSGDWSINFIAAIGNTNFTDINDWGNFVAYDFTSGSTSGATGTTVVNDIRVRSPYMLISTGSTATTFTNATYTIKQYEGDILSYSGQPISYVKTKDKIVSSQNNIWINISNLVREDLESDISYFKDIDYTTARNLSLNESKWVHIDTTLNYLASAVTSGQTFYFAVDGYIEPIETQGLPNVLMTGDKRYIYRGTNERIYFKTDGLANASYITSTNAVPVQITYSGDETYNYGYVKSVKVDNTSLTADWVKYTFTYPSSSTQDVTVYFYDECKYDTYDLVFKNKYGMMESISMSKKSSKALNVNSTDYLRSIVNYEGDFNIDRHTSKQFNVNGNEEWMLNTDFLPEYMNAPIKEAMLTEEMWLIDNAGTIIPVVKVDSNINFKTSLNDKMIQYTLRVRLSHNTIKNII